MTDRTQHIDLIAARMPHWRDEFAYRGLRARHLRSWQRFVGYGASLIMSETLQEEIQKAFERRIHLCAGMGEELMVELVRRYFREHPEKTSSQAALQRLRPYRAEDHPLKS